MAFVLTKDSTLQCGPAPHGGSISVSPAAKLRVGTAPVLIKTDFNSASISGCGAASGSIAACVTVANVLTQESTKLTVGGKPVMIGLTGKTNPTNSTGTLFAVAGQAKLKAV